MPEEQPEDDGDSLVSAWQEYVHPQVTKGTCVVIFSWFREDKPPIYCMLFFTVINLDSILKYTNEPSGACLSCSSSWRFFFLVEPKADTKKH